MEPDFVKWMIGQGGIAIAFVVLFHFYRKDVKSYTDQWRGQSEALIEVVKDNTASNTRLIVLIDALHRRMDREQREAAER